MRKVLFTVWGLIFVFLLWGCGSAEDPYAMIKFRDQPTSNVSLEEGGVKRLGELVFTNVQGEPVDLDQFRGQKNIVLVMTRGYSNGICTFCATQTSRLIRHYKQFTQRNAEVVVVFPVKSKQDVQRRRDLLEKSYPNSSSPPEVTPFPLWLDIELKSVDELGIRSELAKPATYIVDRDGRVRYAYVGETITDRPSVDSLLARLDKINQSGR